MSLPSHAIFEDIYGNRKGTCFINVGWFIDASGLADIIVNELPSVALNRPDIHVVWLYHYSFPVEMLIDMRNSGWDNTMEFLTHIINIEKSYA